ncbi:MAG: ATP-binding protein [Proteobacteria bacterium]|nr:ATP-binding protein [Pseudomonadota bacterium]
MSNAQPIGLAPNHFAEAFPFHLAFDRSFVIRQAGRALSILCPDLLEGSCFFDHFRIERPPAVPDDFDALSEYQRQLFVINVMHKEVKLRGQMMYVQESETMLFLGSPWLTEPGQIGRLGLTFGDFALHDAVIDLLQVMQAQNMALADTRKLADRLSFQRTELREANAALKAEIAVRQQTEEELHEREDTFQMLLESASEGIVIVSEQGVIEMVNARLLSMFGHAREEMMGQTIELLLPQRLAERHAERRAGFVGQPGNRPMGVSLGLFGRRKNGGEFPVDISLSHVHTRQGLRVMGFVSDITERKRIEEALAQARDQALESSRLKSEFLATMSHEIRTPMNSIIGITDLLMETGLEGEQIKLATLVQESGKALLNIINDILDTSKIEAGKLQLEWIDFDLRSEIEVVTAMMHPKAQEKELPLTVYVEPGVPTRLHGDPGRLRQILLNLLSNAIKFTSQGGVFLHVALARPVDQKAGIRFSVEDTGIGIPAAVMGSLFQAFTQADGSTTRKFGGTGLGLAISRNLVELMGGQIGVESKEGAGSTFWFVLPGNVAAEAVAPTPILMAPPEKALDFPATTQKAPPTILLVEDNDLNTLIAMKMLERLGYTADRAVNGREAVNAIRHKPYTLILMDCQMPEMDGFDATRAIRCLEKESGGHAFIIAMTANAMVEDREKCLTAGMDDYLSKPVDRQSLSAVLERWLAKA